MSTHVLIVEGDTALSGRMRAALEARGFSVQETSDGRTCLDVARQLQPACVVLAVDLPAGQNGYILCGKFKKDDDLRTLPIAIVGSSEGFAQHGKLKNRADAYLPKPLHLDAFADRIVALTGHSAPARVEETPVSQSVGQLDAEEATVSGDPDLDLIDAAFDTGPLPPRPHAPEPTPLGEEPAATPDEGAFHSLDSLGGAYADHPQPTGSDVGGLTPVPGTVSATVSDEVLAAARPEEDEPARLQREVARLRAALEDAQASSFSSDVRIHQLEAELAGRASVEEEPEQSARSPRDQILRRDREILRLKADLHAREQELADLREEAMRLEQQALELTGEISRKDAQLKSVQARAEQERRRLEQTVERAEAAEERAAEFQAAVESASARADAAEQEASDLRRQAQSTEESREHAEEELAAARRDRELNRAHADGAQRQLNSIQSALEQSQSDLAAAREQLALKDAARDDEFGALQQRVRELEAVARKHEERVTRLYARLKSEERAREKAARAVAMAGQLLSQSAPGASAPEKTGGGDDEPAAA
jgi:CheY-like chemotaxis protein